MRMGRRAHTALLKTTLQCEGVFGHVWPLRDADWRHIGEPLVYHAGYQQSSTHQGLSKTMSAEMIAVVINNYGDNDVVEFNNIDRPEPKAGEVPVKVHAAGVNPVDWKIRGGLGQRLGMFLPIHLGGEIAGTIERLGEDASEFQVGDAVYGIITSGGFAEYAVAKAEDLSPKPANLDFVQAAAIPLGALTAWQAIFDLAKLSSGQHLLITNSSGSVGSLAVQLAKAVGARVTAMASAHNED